MVEKIGIRPAAIIIENNKLLLVKSLYGSETFYLLPGGGIELGETIEEALVRETLEETGKKIKLVKPVYLNEYINKKDKSQRVVNIFFVSKIIGQDNRKITDDEGKIKSVDWIDLNDLEKINLKPDFLKTHLKEDLKNDFKNSPFYGVTFKNG